MSFCITPLPISPSMTTHSIHCTLHLDQIQFFKKKKNVFVIIACGCVEVRGQLCGVNFLLPRLPLGSGNGTEAVRQRAHLPAEPPYSLQIDLCHGFLCLTIYLELVTEQDDVQEAWVLPSRGLQRKAHQTRGHPATQSANPRRPILYSKHPACGEV